MLRSSDPHSTMDSFVNPAISELSIHICLSSKSTQKSFNQSINASFLSMVWILKSLVSHWAAPGEIDLDPILDIQTLKIPRSSQIATQNHQNPKLKKAGSGNYLEFWGCYCSCLGLNFRVQSCPCLLAFQKYSTHSYRKQCPFVPPWKKPRAFIAFFLLFPRAEARAWILYNS